ncbi:energy transducer TonB [Paraburkholderia oxyphila]|uniref:energy transducer TonB n=1 Tax=Paraburkholderia oxyphila TaxID=614212 RepID=UPI001FE0EA72|nr:energy transducer TonB [Paraburkholderia oxyphila]
MLGLHGLLAIEAFRLFESKATTSEPVALDVQWNTLTRLPASALPVPAPVPPARQDKVQPEQVPPSPSALPHPHRSTALPVRRTAPPQTPQALQTPQAPAPTGSSIAHRSAALAAPQAMPDADADADADAARTNANARPSPAVSAPEEAVAPASSAPSFSAAYLHNPPPAYPAIAQQRAWEGTVLLKVHVLASGKPDQIEVVSSSSHESLDDAAKEAVAGWRFIPAKRAAQAVDGWVQVPIEFKLGT